MCICVHMLYPNSISIIKFENLKKNGVKEWFYFKKILFPFIYLFFQEDGIMKAEGQQETAINLSTSKDQHLRACNGDVRSALHSSSLAVVHAIENGDTCQVRYIIISIFFQNFSFICCLHFFSYKQCPTIASITFWLKVNPAIYWLNILTKKRKSLILDINKY